MTLFTTDSAALAGVSAVVPENVVVLRDELAALGEDEEKAKKNEEIGGLKCRRIAGDRTTAADLCEQAAKQLFDAGVAAAGDIDAIAFVSQTPDYPLPATASILQHKLGLSTGCAAFDLNVGCAGFVHGLWLLSAMITSGACRKALLLVGDTAGRFLSPRNRIVAPLFGDAGTAAVIEHKPAAGSASFLLGNDGAKHEALIIPGGGSRIPHSAQDGPESHYNTIVEDGQKNPWTLGGYGRLWMDGMAVFSFGVSVVPAHIKRHLHLAGLAPGQLDRLMLHQANRLIVETIARKTGVPLEKTPWHTLPRYGNPGAASLPVLLCDEFAGTAPGRGPEKVMLCGFGAGLAWSSCLLSVKETRFLPVQSYTQPDDAPSRDEEIDSWHQLFSGVKSRRHSG